MRRLRPARPRRVLSAVAALAVAGSALPASAQPPPASTSITNVRALRSSGGTPSVLLYDVRHEAHGDLPRGSLLPGAHVAAADHPAAFAGAWGPDAGDVGAWLGAPMQSADQFGPSSTYTGDVFFDDRLLPDWDHLDLSLPLRDGNHGELVFGDLLGTAHLPWGRERSDAPGTLAWDVATDYSTVTAGYGNATGEMDVVVFRADLVARGGDFDATRGPVPAPPLVIDLPQRYPTETEASYLTTTLFPVTQYLAPDPSEFRVLPQLGKAVFQAAVQGYVFEERERTLANGGKVTEWHLPVTGVVMLKPEGDPTPARASMTLPLGGRVTAGDGAVHETVDVPAGGRVVAGSGLLPLGGDEPGAASTSPSQEDLDTASVIDESLASPVTTTPGGGRFDVTIDPDYRSEGVLAVTSVAEHATGTPLTAAAAVPYVIVDGAAVKLDRSRLVDLRAVPFAEGGGVGFTSASGHRPLTRVGTVLGDSTAPGFTLDAVYDLGAGRYAFVTFQVARGPGSPAMVQTKAIVRSLSGEAVHAQPVQYREIPATGPVTVDGTTIATEAELTMPGIWDGAPLRAGDHSFEAAFSLSEIDEDHGELVVKRAPASLTATPVADTTQSIDGEPLALYFTPADGASKPTTVLYGYTDVAEPVPSPKPLGERCGTPQVSDVPDAPPNLDVRTAWLDADAANLYATIEVSDLPAAAPAGRRLAWTFHWRNDHRGHYARAILDSGGWSYEYGYSNRELTYIRAAGVEGEVRTGVDGVVRIAVPRSLLAYSDGDVLRQTAAFGQLIESGVAIDADSAPVGSSRVQGSGGDYVMGSCT